MAKVRADQTVLDYGELARSEALFMSIGEGAVATNSQARISRINKAALDILGFSEKEVIGQWFPDIIVAEDLNGRVIPTIDRPINQIFMVGKAISSRAYYRRKDGTKVPVSMTVSPVIVDGKPIGAIEVFRDITTEISLENSKDEFVAIASHQLRTPATAVRQYLGLLLEGYADPLTENQLTFLRRAYENNERQLRILEDLLKAAQLDLDKLRLKPKKVDINKMVDRAVSTLTEEFDNRSQDVTLKLADKPLEIQADEDQLLAAVENILDNASKYTPQGKRIHVRTAKTKAKAKIVVRDEGVGINPEDHSKLFQKFSRIPNPLSVDVGGTGLGLYLVAKIIELHGGSIKVTSQRGRGTVFTINLPLASPE